MARDLRCTVTEAKERMTIIEFKEWMAFQQMDPTSEWRADYRNAMICATIRSMFGKGLSVSPQKVLDEMMAFEPKTVAEAGPKELEAKILGFFRGIKKSG